MINYCLQLLNEINSYTGDDSQANRIRQLICYISDNNEIEKTSDVKELLFEASQLIRVFGYNWLNKFANGEINENNDFSTLKNSIINKNYQAKSNAQAMLDKAQKEIIDFYQQMDNKRVFVSAPTSFGKTHILKEIIYNNKNDYKNIVLIFPTVALLSENMDSISEFVDHFKLQYKVATTFCEVEDGSRNIFILTPERAITIFEEKPKLNIDFFFFDEVYKIDEDFNTSDEFEDSEQISEERVLMPYSRAVAFRLVLYFLATNSKDFYFAGPYIKIDQLSNGMKLFLKMFKVKTFEITAEATLKTFINAWNKNKISMHNTVGTDKQIEIDGKFDSKKNTISSILDYIKEKKMGQTLVYCDNPGRTLTYAMPNISCNSLQSEKLQNFLSHLKNRYSVKILQSDMDSTSGWSLLKLIDGGIGIHHGKLPKYVQKEILNLFNNGELNTLFCTSTLIEGVNTIAKNIIVASSNIRNNVKLNQFDLKNIIGRAGRYYHHFMGNVFFIDELQEKILNSEPQSLNFSIFDDKSLSAEDLDNIDVDVLAASNKGTKLIRETKFATIILPDRIFFKNRLFDRLKQQNLMFRIMENYYRYKEHLKEFYNIDKVLDENFMTLFLGDLCAADIITDRQLNSNICIIRNYKFKGIVGLLEYEFNYSKDQKKKTVDKGYANAFSKVKTIIEYALPRYFTLLQSLVNYRAETLEDDFRIDFCNTIRYFEIGIKSAVGAYLVEKGLPSITMRDIEEKYRHEGIAQLSIEDGLLFLSQNKLNYMSVLDAYEISIINKLV